jgi:hypothetical protein
MVNRSVTASLAIKRKIADSKRGKWHHPPRVTFPTRPSHAAAPANPEIDARHKTGATRPHIDYDRGNAKSPIRGGNLFDQIDIQKYSGICGDADEEEIRSACGEGPEVNEAVEAGFQT